MFNLLPQDLKKRIKSEYKLRRLIIIFIFIFSVQISAMVFLFPTWLTSLYREKAVISDSEKLNISLSTLSVNPTNESIKSINNKLNIVNSILEYPEYSPYVDAVIDEKNSSILLKEFDYTLKDAKNATLIVGGISKTRESLVLFVKNLEESKFFKTVDLPISNLAKDRNIDFKINLTIELE